MSFHKKSKKKLQKIIIIQDSNEFDYLEKNKEKFKDYLKIIWFPLTFSTYRYQEYFYGDNFVSKKTKYHFDTTVEHNLRLFFKKVDLTLNQEIPELEGHLNTFQNSAHEFKNYFDFYFNEFAKIEYLLKSFKFKYLYLFSQKKNFFSPRLECVLNYIKKKKIKIIEIKKKIGNLNINNFYSDDDLKPNFFKKKCSFNEKIKSYIKNIYLNNLLKNKEKILIISGNFYLINSLKKSNNINFNFIYLQNFFFNNAKINLNIFKNKKIITKLKKIKNLLNFLPKNKYFDYKKFFLNFVLYNFKELTINSFSTHQFIKKLDNKHNFKLAIAQNEEFYSNIIHDYFINKKKKFLILSHGGTIGHYKKSPRVNFYNLNTNKFSYYQSFSLKIEYEMKKIINENYKNKDYNFLKIPHYQLSELKFLYKEQKNKGKKNIVYFASPLNGYYDSKFNIHNEFNLLKIRENFFQNVKDYQIIFRTGYGSKIDQNYKKYAIQNFPNIIFLDDNIPLYKVFEIADIIICEGNSSVVIESLITKKPIILFKRDYPDFTHQSQKLIKKRILIYENLKNILNLTRQFKKLSFKNLKLNDKSFLDDFYDYKTANQINFIRCLENFVNN